MVVVVEDAAFGPADGQHVDHCLKGDWSWSESMWVVVGVVVGDGQQSSCTMALVPMPIGFENVHPVHIAPRQQTLHYFVCVSLLLVAAMAVVAVLCVDRCAGGWLDVVAALWFGAAAVSHAGSVERVVVVAVRVL